MRSAAWNRSLKETTYVRRRMPAAKIRIESPLAINPIYQAMMTPLALMTQRTNNENASRTIAAQINSNDVSQPEVPAITSADPKTAIQLAKIIQRWRLKTRNLKVLVVTKIERATGNIARKMR